MTILYGRSGAVPCVFCAPPQDIPGRFDVAESLCRMHRDILEQVVDEMMDVLWDEGDDDL